MGLEIGNVSDVLVRLLNSRWFRELNRFINVSRSGYGTSFWIKIRKKIVRGCEFKLGGFIRVRNDRRAEISRINITTITESSFKFKRAAIYGPFRTARAFLIPGLEIMVQDTLTLDRNFVGGKV